MNVLIKKSIARGKVQAPPSKSMAHRLLICSFLAGGGKISGEADSEDIKATKSCIEALRRGDDILECNESGSTLRFFIPICLMQGRKITLRGTKRLLSRGLSVYEDICRQNSMLFEHKEQQVTVCGPMEGGIYKVRGDISSQFISGLLFALPLAKADSVIEIEGKLESRPYIDLTLRALSLFGVKIGFDGRRFEIPGAQKYLPADMSVEGDYSNAAFFDALGLVGGSVSVSGLDEHSLQGDKVYRQYFESLDRECPTLDIGDCPDLAPILMAVAAVRNGCRLINTARLKITESDRGAAMAVELSKIGADVQVFENEIVVLSAQDWTAPTFFGHNDHRIVMALSVLCTIRGGRIEGAEAVSKSLPEFFKMLSELGIEVEKYEA